MNQPSSSMSPSSPPDLPMVPLDFQFERDSFNRKERRNELHYKLPLSVGEFIGRSNLIIFSASNSSKNSKRFVNVQFLLNNSSDILLKNVETPAIFLNPLEKLAYGFNKIREDRRRSEVSENGKREFGMKETFKMWEDDLLSVSKCLTYFDEFQELSFNLKMKILKGIWVVWCRFEKFESAAIERRKTFGARKWMWEKKDIRIDLSWCSKYSFEELKFFGTTNIHRLYSMMQSMLELELTDVELIYMICQFCLQHVGKRHQGEILEVCERLQDSLSNSLHEYYSRSFGLARYSARLASMMKFNNFIHQEIYQRRVKLDFMKVFDVFNIEFSDPELFVDYL
ncbi:hypothetical protein CAEBREN_05610 [Caenorhabditis brenneri]|uniref:NR LBD domain-containing protein n=1 Tax=Caenorhabditis brenneri TaxID=135651 RepID=G0NEP6_CAEBE|nr:hypothetical protein CAEBREN_05610 [Caenorhabditis brenneri]